MSKILFTDLDDTLLSSDKTVSEANKAAIKEMLDAGHYIAFTTGRPLHGARLVIDKLGLPKHHCYLLCFQGAFLYDLENECDVIANPMEKEDVKALVQHLSDQGIYTEAFSRDVFYCVEETEATHRYTGVTKEAYELVDDWSILDEKPIYKVMAIDYEDKSKLLSLQKEAKETNLAFESFFSSQWFYEYCGQGQNKGNGVKLLAKWLGVDMADTVAVGDEENDISMIEDAQIGVAMVNARDEIKAHADVITTRDNNQGGVAEVIERYILEKY